MEGGEEGEMETGVDRPGGIRRSDDGKKQLEALE